MPDIVLIADDDQAVLTMLYKVVRSNGIEADTAASGEEIKSGAFPKEVSLHSYDARTPSDHFPVVVRLEFRR